MAVRSEAEIAAAERSVTILDWRPDQWEAELQRLAESSPAEYSLVCVGCLVDVNATKVMWEQDAAGLLLQGLHGFMFPRLCDAVRAVGGRLPPVAVSEEDRTRILAKWAAAVSGNPTIPVFPWENT